MEFPVLNISSDLERLFAKAEEPREKIERSPSFGGGGGRPIYETDRDARRSSSRLGV